MHVICLQNTLLDKSFKKAIEKTNGAFLYTLYEKCIKHNIPITAENNPFFCNSMQQFKDLKKKISKLIKTNTYKSSLSSIPEDLRTQPSTEYNKWKHVLDFEERMGRKTLNTCPSCLSVSLDTCSKSKRNFDPTNKICSLCYSQHDSDFKFDTDSQKTKSEQRHEYYLKNEMLPVWYEKDDLIERKNPKYHVPDELQDLTNGEILLIQRYSAYIPVFHMSKGQTALKGHCVCFFQDTASVCEELPRKKCNIVKIVKTYQDSGGETVTSHFTINKTRVLTALRWLKDHNKYYHDITIKEDNLSWMNGEEECELNSASMNVIENNLEVSKYSQLKENVSVCPNQTSTPNSGGSFDVHGACNNKLPVHVNKNDIDILNELREEIISKTGSKSVSFMNFPDVSEEAVNEYNEDVLPNIFPHLYPGGIGGSNNHYNKQSLHRYAKRLLNYKDGRFATDNVWSYYVLDMIQRNKNNNDGNYIIKSGYLGQACTSVDDLKKKIKKGDFSWIDMLRNFSRRIRGSDNYWRSKRHEVESWINYHVELGHGAPSLFITLSCAENWWKDLQHLLSMRMVGTKYSDLINDMNSDDEKTRMSARSKVSKLFSVLVQDFFQERVDEWIKTVGKNVFGIEYFWARFEFAKGRGQIHLHLLAIVNNRHHQKQFFQLKKKKGIEEATKVLTTYAREVLGLIAEHPAVLDTDSIKDHPKVSSKTCWNIFLLIIFLQNTYMFLKLLFCSFFVGCSS